MALKLRQWFLSAMPSWQSGGEGTPLFWSLLWLADAMVLRSKLALNMHFPTRSGPSANALTGKTRGIAKGRSETDAHYALRLTKYRAPRAHRVKGNGFEVLDQIVEYFAAATTEPDGKGASVRCYLVTERRAVTMRGATHVYLTDSPTYSRDVELTEYNYESWFSWDAKSSDTYWSRFQVYVTPNPQLPEIAATPNLGDPALWGGAIGTPGYVIGMVGWTSADTVAMRKLFYSRRQWKPAFTRATWLVVQLTDWTSEIVFSDETPLWVHWSFDDAGVRRAARAANARYISLSPGNAYAGNPAQFTAAFVEPDGVTEYAGDPTSFPATITLPTGAAYAGNPNNFPPVIHLVDDGDEAR